MALFNECMQECARKGLDTADIVRDGDLTPIDETAYQVEASNNFRFADHPGAITERNDAMR